MVIVGNWMTLMNKLGKTGNNKKRIHEILDGFVGKEHWRKAWVYNANNTERIYTKPDVFEICEDAYFIDSVVREDKWMYLLSEAKDVYDYDISEISAGCDYTKQGSASNFHDICIRNVVKRRGWKFKGDKIIQIRAGDGLSKWDSFDPGRVKFHNFHLILTPYIKGYWDDNSVESFYQNNKMIQISQFAYNNIPQNKLVDVVERIKELQNI